MQKIFNPFDRRRMLLGSLAVSGGVLALAACEGGGGNNASDGGGATSDLEARGTSDKLEDLVDNNPQPVDNLEKGGTLTLTVGSLGPNFFGWSNAGNSADNSTIQAATDRAGVWSSETDGTPTLNKDFCTDAKYDDSGDKPVITYTLHPDATWNDGTPYDWKTFENQWRMMNGSDPTIDAVSTQGYDRIEKVEAGKDDKEVVVTLKEVYQPWTDLFSGTFHPAVNTPEIFNNGYVNNLHPEWMAGPFELEELDTVQRRVIIKPNEKWWGEKPILDHVIYREMESSATIPAFKNGEIDLCAISNIGRYNEMKGFEPKDVRRSQNLSVSGINFNTTKGVLGEVEVRKAIYQGLDRQALANLRFNGINWTEELPGSWMLMPFSPYYENNFPVEHDKEAAKKTLEDAGWKAEGDGARTKDGKTLDISITNFGDDPLSNAITQTIQKNLEELGFKATIDSKGSGDFGKVMEERSFQLVMMGYTVGSDPTFGPNQFFNSQSSSNMTGTGSDEIDELIPKVSVSPELEERSKLANECEKKFQELYCMMPLWNGPSITAYTPGLGNYGPQLYETRNWSIVGWEKGKKKG